MSVIMGEFYFLSSIMYLFLCNFQILFNKGHSYNQKNIIKMLRYLFNRI